jgi:ethanolamine utilization cobalamin adenosyltransferase
MPLLSIGGTVSNEKVTNSKNKETEIIANETINESLKKKGRTFLSALFFLSSTLFILRISTFLNYLV